jgi:hypothetical protein
MARARVSGGDTFGILIAIFIIALVKGWALMVGLGILGLSVAFWPAVAAAFLLTVALGSSVQR